MNYMYVLVVFSGIGKVVLEAYCVPLHSDHMQIVDG